MGAARAVARGLVIASSLVHVGCPSPNTYGTPRTVAPGKFAHTAALEGYGGTYVTRDAKGNESTESALVPTLPTYQLRAGVADRVDLGFRISNLTSLGGDAKFNIVRSEVFDLALDPGVQWIHLKVGDASSEIFYFHAPLLLGFNLGKRVSIVATPGAVYNLVSSEMIGTGGDGLTSAGGIFARLGLGLNLRFSDHFAMQPEVTAMRGFGDGEAWLFSVGLGFNFGTLPLFGPEPARGEPARGDVERNPDSDDLYQRYMNPTGAPKRPEEVLR
jgi:hypothetical protein